MMVGAAMGTKEVADQAAAAVETQASWRMSGRTAAAAAGKKKGSAQAQAPVPWAANLGRPSETREVGPESAAPAAALGLPARTVEASSARV